MRYHVLATDYDGTLARDGHVDDASLTALQKAIDSGRVLILVTGRRLDDLLTVFPHPELFERIVAENGALLYNPRTREQTVLGEAPSGEFVAALRDRGVEPVSAGRVVVATWSPHETAVLETIRELGLERQVIFNKGAVMVLPTGVNKASGLTAALTELGLSCHNAVAIGDAENDHTLLAACECGVAVANALPSLKERADLVTAGDHGTGVAELVGRLIESDLRELEPRLQRHAILLGHREDGAEVRLPPFGVSVLLAGTSGGGKSTVSMGFLERLCAKGYQYCIIDPEGDYNDIGKAVVMGDKDRAPSIPEILEVLRQPAQNIVINLIGLSLEHRPAFFESLLPHLQELRAKYGRPHWIVIDETHHLLPSSWDATEVFPQSMHGTWLVTVHPEHVSRPVLSLVDMIVAIGKSPDRTIGSFSETLGRPAPRVPEVALRAGEAIAWMPESTTEPFWFQSVPPAGERKRHQRKYAEGELPPDRSFYFRGPEGKLNLRAHNLNLFLQMADGVDDETWLHHLREGDYSEWFRTGIKDDSLADAAAGIEKQRDIPAQRSRELIRSVIEERYTAPA